MGQNNRAGILVEIKRAVRWLNLWGRRHGFKLWLVGTLVELVYSWRCWQKDKRLAEKLASATKAEKLPELQAIPPVSVLVAAWNEAVTIDKHFQTFLELPYPNIELIICAGGTDDTLARARHYEGERVKVLAQLPGEGKQRALARCLAHAKGELIYLTDADCLYDYPAMLALLAALINQGEAVATGRFSPLPGQRHHPFVSHQWAVDSYVRAHAGPYIGGLIGRNAALTRKALETSEALTQVIAIGTDYYLAKRLIRLGYCIRYVHESVVPTGYHTRFGPYLRQQTRWLRNIVVHGFLFGESREVRKALANCGVGLVAVALPLTGPLSRWFWLTGLGFVSFNRLRYLKFAQLCGQPVPWQAFVTAPFYAALDLGMLAYAGLNILFQRRNQW